MTKCKISCMNENVWPIVTCSPTGSFATYCTIEMVAGAFWTSFLGLEFHMLSKMSHHVNQPTPMCGLVSCDVPFVWDTGHCVATVCTGWFSWLLCWCTRVLPGWTQVSQKRSKCESQQQAWQLSPPSLHWQWWEVALCTFYVGAPAVWFSTASVT